VQQAGGQLAAAQDADLREHRLQVLLDGVLADAERWRNASAEREAVYLGIYAPGGFEKYFPAVRDAAAAAGGLSPEVVQPLWEQYGIGVSSTGANRG
jgi:hypothetical protein